MIFGDRPYPNSLATQCRTKPRVRFVLCLAVSISLEYPVTAGQRPVTSQLYFSNSSKQTQIDELYSCKAGHFVVLHASGPLYRRQKITPSLQYQPVCISVDHWCLALIGSDVLLRTVASTENSVTRSDTLSTCVCVTSNSQRPTRQNSTVLTTVWIGRNGEPVFRFLFQLSSFFGIISVRISSNADKYHVGLQR